MCLLDNLLILNLMTRHLFTVLFFCCAFISFSHAQHPTVHASNLTANQISCHDAVLTWTNGNGSDRVVWVSENSPLSSTPIDGRSYNGHPHFGTGMQVDNNAYCVLNGKGNSVQITGLKTGHVYYVYVFEYNMNSGAFLYLSTGGYAQINFTTERIIAQFTTNQVTQCLTGNEYTQMNSSIGPLGDKLQYKWTIPGVGTDTSKDVSYSYTTGGLFSVKLEVTSQSGCKASTTKIDTVVIPYNVEFHLDPTYHSAADTLRCTTSLDSFKLSNTSTVPGSPSYGPWDRSWYSWTTNIGAQAASKDFAFGTTQKGIIRVQLIITRQVNHNGVYCPDTAVRTYRISAPFNPGDVKVDTISSTLSNNEFRFTQSSQNLASHTWNFGDGKTSNMNSVLHSYSMAGSYQANIIGTDTNGCSDTIAIPIRVVDDNASIKLVRKSDIIIAPNPTTNTITLLGDEVSTSSYRIYDLTGKEFLTNVLKQTREINVSTLPSGIYILDFEGYAPIRFTKM